MMVQVTRDPQYYRDFGMRVRLGKSMFVVHSLPEMVSFPFSFNRLSSVLRLLMTSRLKKHIHNLEDGEYRKYNRWLQDNESVKYRSLLEAQNLQPFAAWVGLILNLLILFLFTTASWWRRSLTPTEFFAAYAGVSLPFSCTVTELIEQLTLDAADCPVSILRYSEDQSPLLEPEWWFCAARAQLAHAERGSRYTGRKI